MADPNRIGEYLRARREQLRPADVGLPDLGRRRVPGLRREELALLAGISADYYLRLEQGRDHHPSEQVLDALARALRLDEDATAHLHGLARPARRGARRAASAPVVPPSLAQLIAGWPLTPAIVQGRLGRILAANALATALTPIYAPGQNGIRELLLDPEAQRLFRDWEGKVVDAVAGLRAHVGPDVDDPELAELVGELSVRSATFRELWARHDARPRSSGGTTRLEHPRVGPLELRFEKLEVVGAGGIVLVAYHADPGSTSERALELLRTTLPAASPEPAG